MINIERSKEVHIKRANTDWWINEKSMVGNNGKTYIAYVTDMGEIHVKELDAKCSRESSKDVCLCRLNNVYSDEHNAPSIVVMENGKIIVAYASHGQMHTMRYRISERPFDITSFGPEKILNYHNDRVTYVQLSENTEKHQLWLFTRINGINWEFRYSSDEGETWTDPTRFLVTETSGSSALFYLDIRKILFTEPSGQNQTEKWFFALYGHPRSSDHTIRAGLFDTDGNLTKMNGESNNFNLFGTTERKQLTLSDLETVYSAPEGETVRLLEVSPTLPFRVGLAAFKYRNLAIQNDPIAESITYYIARYDNNGWRLSEPIAKGGEFLAPAQTDGSQTYVAGMACYYGVGDAGYHSYHSKLTHSITDRVYIARFDGQNRVLESYVSRDRSQTYTLEQVIRSIPADPSLPEYEQIKIWRPTVPIYAQDNLPVYWHEGTYSAHTGGWHCDEVMFIEYDD